GAFSAGLAVQALIGMWLGRVLDLHGPRIVMTVGSLLSAGGLLVVATAPYLTVFYLGWFITGLGMAGTLYPPAFTAITVWFSGRHLAPMTALTLVAGLASTVFAPLAAAVASQLGWRETYALAALTMIVITLPLHWFVLRRPWPVTAHSRKETRVADTEYAA